MDKEVFNFVWNGFSRISNEYLALEEDTLLCIYEPDAFLINNSRLSAT